LADNCTGCKSENLRGRFEMSITLLIVILLNFVISLVGTLAYSVRIVGVRTGKIAISFALFNAVALISRTANVFQLPLLTKYVESNSMSGNIEIIFMEIIGIVLLATIIGAFLIPTFQRIFSKAVNSFSIEKSIFKLMMHSFSKSGIIHIKSCIKTPEKSSVEKIKRNKLPLRIFVFNTLAVALLTAGVFAPIYAIKIAPDVRATCVQLSSVVNSIATIFLAIFIDPYLSVLTDDVIVGKYSELDFRGCVIGMVGSKVLGTALSVLLLFPAANAIACIARM
jgi:hypothetical protein